jgi:hypothetical protein
LSQKEVIVLKDALDKSIAEAAAAQANASRARNELSLARRCVLQLNTALNSIGVSIDVTAAGKGQGGSNFIFRPVISAESQDHAQDSHAVTQDDVGMLRTQISALKSEILVMRAACSQLRHANTVGSTKQE